MNFLREKQMKFNEYIEYVKETCLEIGEEKIMKKVVTNMLLQGKNEKDIQATLSLTANQVSELIRNVQNNAQA